MELANLIEAILFYHAEPLSIKRLAYLTKKNEGEVRDAIMVLEEKLLSSGLRLLQNDDEVVLGTSPSASTLIEAITKEELSKELSKASLETLAIVLYKGPISRAEIDYVRGVNSTFILRNLLIRGLVEKVDNPSDQRSFLYKPTFALLEHMGVTKIEELPEYDAAKTTLAEFLTSKETEMAELEAIALSVEDSSSQHADGKMDNDEEANIAEEDEAIGNFDDQALEEHRQHDAL